MEENLKKTIRLAGIVPESVVDGSGIRFTLFVQGCPHRCEGCHNPQTHEYEGGKEMQVSEIVKLIEANPLLDGVTFSGGEPFLFAEPLVTVAKAVHQKNMNVWCYTGYTLGELTTLADSNPAIKALLDEIDILIDGRFEQEKLDLTLKFRGSTNQRLINLKKSRQENKLILLE